jgi:hypothetical protein
MNKTALAICLISFPIPHINRTIIPQLNAFSVSQPISRPLSMINSSIIKLIWNFIYSFNFN